MYALVIPTLTVRRVCTETGKAREDVIDKETFHHRPTVRSLAMTGSSIARDGLSTSGFELHIFDLGRGFGVEL